MSAWRGLTCTKSDQISSFEVNRRIQISGGGYSQPVLLVRMVFIVAMGEAEEGSGGAVVVIGCLAEEAGLGTAFASGHSSPPQPNLGPWERASFRMTQYPIPSPTPHKTQSRQIRSGLVLMPDHPYDHTNLLCTNTSTVSCRPRPCHSVPAV